MGSCREAERPRKGRAHARHTAFHLAHIGFFRRRRPLINDAERPLRFNLRAAGWGSHGMDPAAFLRDRGPAAAVSHASHRGGTAKLVPNGFDSVALPHGLSRGKGVLAA